MKQAWNDVGWGSRLLSAAAMVMATVSAANAEMITDLRPFLYDTETPDRIYLIGQIEDARTPVRLSQALSKYPNAETLVLASRGGAVYLALPMAYAIRAAGLKTHIPEEASCESACAYLYFAGVERSADGPLGVHQLSASDNNIVTGQIALADIVTAYEEFGVPTEVLRRILMTPPDEMHLFPPETLAALGLTGTDHSVNHEPMEPSAWRQAFVLELTDAYTPGALFDAGCFDRGYGDNSCDYVRSGSGNLNS